MILKLHGHIGSTASALVDGQLGAEEEERAWAHVYGCAGCRRLVEREGWTKQRLAGLSRAPEPPRVPSALTTALGDLGAAVAWAQVEEIERRSNRRRATAVLVGAGSVGVAAAAFLGLAGSGTDVPGAPTEPSPAMIRSDVVDAAIGGALRPALQPAGPGATTAANPGATPVLAPGPHRP